MLFALTFRQFVCTTSGTDLPGHPGPEAHSQMLGHASPAITEQVYTSVFEDVERAGEQSAALVPRAHRAPPRGHRGHEADGWRR